MDNWYLGIDIGTSSVGWAVTNGQYEIPRLRGQRAWGVRIFEEAQTSADRRAKRIARRRYRRRAERLKLLRQIFTPYINNLDPHFFERLQDSFLWAEDKRESTPGRPQKHSIFNDADYTDKEYYHDFPTIFHLRDYLMFPDGSKRIDARHYFLACHNIIKFRGHFLFEGEIKVDEGSTTEKYSSLFSKLQSELLENLGFEYGPFFDIDENDNVAQIDFSDALLDMLSTKGKLTDKKNRIKNLSIETDLDEDRRDDAKDAAKLIANYILGSKVDFAKICECEGKAEIQLGQANTDDKIAELLEKIGISWQGILEIGKELYDIGVARQIIGEYASLSKSHIALFDKFKTELDLYNSSVPDKKERQTHVLSEPRTITDEDGKEKEQKKIAKPKLRGYYKGAVPMQLHLAELESILTLFAADKRYAAFATANTAFKDDPSNVLDRDKVIKLLTHRVPYYVGPLQTEQANPSKQAKTSRQEPWCVRTKGQGGAKIYPWNFAVVVDKAASAERFIARMVGRCTYLVDQPCLPKDSVLYQRYMILNELNKLRLDGVHIDAQTKQALFTELFLVKADITLSTIKEWFKSRGDSGDIDIADSAGIGGTINHKMTSYLKFKLLFGDETDRLLPKIEKAILSITVLPDDREMLKERIANIFVDELKSGLLDDEKVNKISNYNFSKWGKLSARLLDGMKANINGHELTIIEALWQSNNNFMELVAGSGPFAEGIAEYKKQHGAKSTDELIESSYASVPVKRACRQAIKIIHELESIIGCPPAKVFIEAPRSNEDSKRTDNRKKQLDTIYNSLKDDVKSYNKTKNELAGYQNSDLKPKAVYLYFLQNGRCAYSNEELDIASLVANCDIDHIVPQALIKDDSFDNLVLVKKELNRAKSDTYPINKVDAIRFERMLPIWKSWHKNGLISDKKYRSLSRTSLTMDELAGFINRQLVETSQTTKMVMDILKLVMPNTEIVYQKAETIAEFKREWAHYEGKLVNHSYQNADGSITTEQKFKPWLYVDGNRLQDADGNPAFSRQGEKRITKLIKPQFIKLRDLNDLHHAKDAYLSIVVGNVYSTKFTNNPLKWLRDRYGDKPEAVKLSMRTVMYDDRKVLADGTRGEVKTVANRQTGEIVWDAELLQTVIDTHKRNDILMSVRRFDKGGAIFDQNILPYAEGKIRFPIKRGMDVKKYGGYTGSYSAYFAYIRDMGDKKQRKRFVAIPLRFADEPKKYLEREFPDCEVLIEKVPVKSTLLVKGHLVTLDGSTGKNILCSNLKQLLLDDDVTEYLARILKAQERLKADRNYVISEDGDRINSARNAAIFDTFLGLAKGAYKTRPNAQGVTDFLEQKREDFLQLSLNDQVSMIVSFLRMFQRVARSSSGINCELLKGGAQMGTTGFSVYETDIKLVITSVTGLYKKVIDLGQL